MSLMPALVLLFAAAAPPRLLLWLWHTPEAKMTLPPGIGVAFVIASLDLSGSKDVTVFPRRGAAALPAGTYRMGVIRIEQHNAAFTAKQRAQTAQIVAEAVEITRVPAIQIDFDAPKSAWPFYRALMKAVRQRIGPGVFLSITALASWCEADSWLAGADVDEFVPMLFQMGPSAARILDRLRDGGQFPFPGCRQSAGVSLEDQVFGMPDRRIYIFPGYAGWTQENISRALKRYQP